MFAIVAKEPAVSPSDRSVLEIFDLEEDCRQDAAIMIAGSLPAKD